MTTEHLITDRPPVRRPTEPIRNGPGDPTAKALTTTLFLCGTFGLLFGAAGEHTITYAALATATTAIALATAYRRTVK